MTRRPSPAALSRDLDSLVALSTSSEEIDQLLGDALDSLASVVPYDLATVMELDERALRVRVARGRLASPRVIGHRLELARLPSLERALRHGHARAFHEQDHAHEGDPFDGVLDLPHGHACMVVPLVARGDQLGLITLDRAVCGDYPQGVVGLMDAFGAALALALKYGEQSHRLSRLRAQLEEQNRVLSESLNEGSEATSRLDASQSESMAHVRRLARQVAPTSTPVLITGETGTGKEQLARAIHAWSPRARGPLVSVNCAALPEGLIESELFGHVKGAFSGASHHRIGRFQAAHGGTLFLDEIGELPLALQPKLLRALQESSIEPVGSDKSVRVDVRIIAATHVDLARAVAERGFREDLYYRLAVFPVQLPPLRARPEDIEPIAERFLAELAARTGRGPWTLPERALAELKRRPWPGNVRELVNTLERATILCSGRELLLEELAGEAPARASAPAQSVASLADSQRAAIEGALAAADGRVWGPGGAAELLRIHPSTLASRMQKLGIARPRARRAAQSGGG